MEKKVKGQRRELVGGGTTNTQGIVKIMWEHTSL